MKSEKKDIAQSFGYTTSKPRSNKPSTSSKASLVKWTKDQMENRSFDKALRKRLEAHGFTPEGHSYPCLYKKECGHSTWWLNGNSKRAPHLFCLRCKARTYLNDIGDALKAWKQADSNVGEIELVDELTT